MTKSLKVSSVGTFNARRSVAFTLAEILITLAIIGVVSAMTIPNLIAKTQQAQMLSKLKKTYSTLNQAYKLSLEENGRPKDDEMLAMGNVEYFNTYWKPYLKGAKYLTYQAMGYKSLQPFILTNGEAWVYNVNNNAFRTVWSLADGIYVMINVAANGFASSYIVVDLNGSTKPNTLGKDVFLFDRTENYIQTYGYSRSDTEINNNCSKSGDGKYCATMIKNNGWKLPANYPW